VHQCKLIGDRCERVVGLLACTRQFPSSASDLLLAITLVTDTHALYAHSQSLFLQRLLTGHCFLLQWVTSGYLLRLRTHDDVSLPPDVSAPPVFFLGDFASTPLCSKRLPHVCLILVYLNLVLLCLPIIFTGMFSLSSVPLRIRAPQLGSHSLQPNPAHQSVTCLLLSRNIIVLSGIRALL